MASIYNFDTTGITEAELEAQAIANIKKRREERLRRIKWQKIRAGVILLGLVVFIVLGFATCTARIRNHRQAKQEAESEQTESVDQTGSGGQEQIAAAENTGPIGGAARAVTGSFPTDLDVTTEDGTHMFSTGNGFLGVEKDGVTRIGGIVIANKTYSVPAGYGDGLTDETEAAFDEMAAAAAEEGLHLEIVSGFRSYDTQTSLFNRYVSADGVAEAERYSARPGHSEHQLGEAMDLNRVDQSFADTAEGKWCYDHCHEYGFILRYPSGKEGVTGYMEEPWHFRYVGKDLASVLYNGGNWITVEEYFGITSEYAD